MARKNSFDVIGKAYVILSECPDKRFTARQIAEKIPERFPDECEKKRKRASVDFKNYTFEDQLVAEIGSRWRRLIERYDEIETIEKRPREFYFSTQTEDTSAGAQEINVETSSAPKRTIKEHDLYPLLGEYVAGELKCMTMRIDERRSKNSRGPKGNHWLFPDVVGLEVLSEGWSNEMRSLVKATGYETARLYSFEVKLRVNRSNVREVFFQTLSNSAWAHYAYLCATEINSHALDELSMLCSYHGIGLIRINPESTSDSQIVIPAELKANVDWNLLNRLAQENRDAKSFVKNVRDFYLTGETSIRAWNLSPRNDD